MTDPNKPDQNASDDDWEKAMAEQQGEETGGDDADPWAEALAERRIVLRRATECELVKFFALLVDPEDPDVSYVVMTARIHAARHLDLHVPDVVQIIDIIETLVNLVRDRDRPGVRE